MTRNRIAICVLLCFLGFMAWVLSTPEWPSPAAFVGDRFNDLINLWPEIEKAAETAPENTDAWHAQIETVAKRLADTHGRAGLESLAFHSNSRNACNNPVGDGSGDTIHNS
jgi:hypothetical protein